ncbi:MAG: hypothetical protein KGI04_04890 [Candidatus Micrarchaeota archaeon]|nr:hypothetical protein [Candidatus Micrarchaeota archaeon]
MDSVLVYALVFLLLVHRFISIGRRAFAVLVIFLVAGAALALYEGADAFLMLLGVLIFSGMASTYRSKENYAFFLLAVFFVVPLHYFTTLVPQAMLLGLLSGASLFLTHARRASTEVERKRDVAQIAMGLAFITAFVLIAAVYVRLLLIAAILLASLAGNYGVSNKRGIVSRALHSFERSDAVLGQGAMWLAAGTLFAMSFLGNMALAAVLVAIFVGDAVATLVGTRYRLPLPYNAKKSLWGSLAYFAAVSVIAFPFVGYLSLPVAFVGSLVESAPSLIDDNFDTSVTLTVLLALLGYASVAL